MPIKREMPIQRKMTEKEMIVKRIELELRLFAILKEKSQLRLAILEEKLAEVDSNEERSFKRS